MLKVLTIVCLKNNVYYVVVRRFGSKKDLKIFITQDETFDEAIKKYISRSEKPLSVSTTWDQKI